VLITPASGKLSIHFQGADKDNRPVNYKLLHNWREGRLLALSGQSPQRNILSAIGQDRTFGTASGNDTLAPFWVESLST
jgi:hypothetical protein